MQQELSPVAQRYVAQDASITLEMHTQNISHLENLGNEKTIYINELRQKERAFEEPSTVGVDYSYQKYYINVAYLIYEIECQCREYEINSWDYFLRMSSEILMFLRHHPQHFCPYVQFEREMRRQFGNDAAYRSLRKQRKILIAKSKRIVMNHHSISFVNQIRTEIINSVSTFDKTALYYQPNRLDNVFGDYISLQPSLRPFVMTVAQKIASGTVESALGAINEFHQKLCEMLNVSMEPARTILFISSVRFLYEQAYWINPELAALDKENSEFLEKCEAYSQQPVRELQLSDVITQGYTMGLPVSSLFKSKQVHMLKSMELMTNPIDLMYHVHDILTSLATYFASSEGFISFDDTLTLLLSLMSLNPPANAVSIAAFLRKWHKVTLSPLVSAACNYFIAAVEHLLPLPE